MDAGHVASLGHRPEEILLNAWNGSSFAGVDSILDTLSNDLSKTEHQRRAFPSVQYFHPADRSRSSEAMLAMLDDAVTLWTHGVAQAARPAPAALQSARRAVRDYLQVLRDGPISPSDDPPPPPPDLGPLRAAGIPTVADADFAQRLEELEEHRRMLLAVVRSDAWEWHDAGGR